MSLEIGSVHRMLTVPRAIPRTVWVLGFVSLFMDISSEMIHALLPIYLVTVLGASTVTVGLIEGIAEATAAITKIFSGVLSDRLGKRKALVVLGYGMAAFTKPVFPLASNIGLLVVARFVDRTGKGIRGAPRDALIADVTPPELRGASFGLRQSLDTIGAFIGPLAAIGLMLLSNDQFKLIFWIAVIPAFISFGLLIVGVEEPKSHQDHLRAALRLADAKRLRRPYWILVVFVALLTLARCSEAFLILRALNVGLPAALVPLILVVMNIFYALAAFPAGLASDRFGRNGVLVLGISFLIVADILLASGLSIVIVMLGVVFWGLHMGFSQGIFAAVLADIVPADLRGSAFGFFNLVSGLAMLAASLMAGLIWDVSGPAATFVASAGVTSAALLVFVFTGRNFNPLRVNDAAR
jgi:MFS family permease